MNKINRITIGMFVVAFLLGCMLTGCAKPSEEAPESVDPNIEVSEDIATESTATSAPESSTPESSEPEPDHRTIGTEDAKAFAVLIKNNTGREITGIAVKSSNEKEYPQSILPEGQPMKQDETLKLLYTPSDTGEDSDTENIDPDNPDTAVAFSVTYDIQLTFTDKSTLELYDFGFKDMTEATLCVEDGVAFVKYKSKTTGESVDTKNAQLAAKVKNEEKEADTPAKNSNNKSTTKSKPKSKPKSTPSQNTDECLDDNIDWND